MKNWRELSVVSVISEGKDGNDGNDIKSVLDNLRKVKGMKGKVDFIDSNDILHGNLINIGKDLYYITWGNKKKSVMIEKILKLWVENPNYQDGRWFYSLKALKSKNNITGKILKGV